LRASTCPSAEALLQQRFHRHRELRRRRGGDLVAVAVGKLDVEASIGEMKTAASQAVQPMIREYEHQHLNRPDAPAKKRDTEAEAELFTALAAEAEEEGEL
jgi:hypothetical protein